MERIKFLAVILTCALFAFGCDNLFPQKKIKKPAENNYLVRGPIVAKVNGMPITLSQLNKEADSINQLVDQQKTGKKITTKEEKLDYLNKELVKRFLLYQEALDKKLDRNPDVAEAIETVKIQLLVGELLKKELANTVVTSQELEDFYNQNKAYLKSPEERKIREIITDTEYQAKQALIELLQGKDFAAVASSYSKSSSASRGGDLGFVEVGKNTKEFDEVVFSPTLEKGKYSSIFRGPTGYYIVKIEDIRGGKEKPLSEVREDLKNYLTLMKQEKKIQDLIGNLQAQARIEIFEEQI